MAYNANSYAEHHEYRHYLELMNRIHSLRMILAIVLPLSATVLTNGINTIVYYLVV
ncbi:MAG TPA: hypothetical protein VEL11_09470 [Candidatus Bathyarchaeia archaeon]|nr:hypothetical protein [Candidatus Bathyarchaeia archaeon]